MQETNFVRMVMIAASSLVTLALITSSSPEIVHAQGIPPTATCVGPVVVGVGGGTSATVVPQACASVGPDPPPVDTRCDQAGQCSVLRIDDAANPLNVLDTIPGPGGPTPDSLTWGGSKVLTENANGAFLVPSGAVMAFDLANCPAGWTPFVAAAGRNIIGVGAGAGLTPRAPGDTGGEERHTMTVSELASHSHNIVFNKHNAADGGNGDFGPGGGNNYGTDPTGGGQPFNVMDPFVALLYCKKL